MRPLVSLIVVAFNTENYLVACLDGLSAQDWPRESREFVLVDGRSTDRIRRIMEDFRAAKGIGRERGAEQRSHCAGLASRAQPWI